MPDWPVPDVLTLIGVFCFLMITMNKTRLLVMEKAVEDKADH